MPLDGKVSKNNTLHAETATGQLEGRPLPVNLVTGLLETLGPLVLTDRGGKILFSNLRARQYLSQGVFSSSVPANLFTDLFKVSPKVIFEQIEGGEHEVNLLVRCPDGEATARIQWLPEPDWLVVQLVPATSVAAQDGNQKHTVQELLHEREITYRNLLAAYLRLQEVNRQKTMFLASAAHALKTPLAVIKGYYDLLLSGSLGKLTPMQSDILHESKESCERLVRLVSMFLNDSALESGKLTLHLHDNDLRDCLHELTKRWSDAFQRKRIRLETRFDSNLPIFKFDYQKIQQVVVNLLDNALKHTPAGGCVTLTAEPHFWERRIAEEAPEPERRKHRIERPNSVRVAVSDTGPGIAAEHHQEIFEDFVRLERSSSGMGLGLAIAKRLVQSHRGKIWVDSEPRRGCTFTFLLPAQAQ